MLSNLDDLYSWERNLIKPVFETASPELASTVKGLIAPDDQEIDVVRKVFYWVQENVRYIAFEDGMRGLIPHSPTYVYEKRYGDCKDMASLIVGMLNVAGIKAYCTTIGTRKLPFRYSQEPTLRVANHMIATYIDVNKNYYFLDATSNYTSYAFPSSMIQGKEGMLALGEKNYEVRVVPEVPADKSTTYDTVTLRIEKGSLYGKGSARITGYKKIDASYDFSKTREESTRENVAVWARKGSNKFFLDSYAISDIKDRDKPLGVKYDFHIGSYANEIGNEIYVNLNLDKLFYNDYITPGRKEAIETEFRFRNISVYTLEIPSGYEVEYMPPDALHHGKVLSFEKKYSITGNQVTLTSSLSYDSLLIAPDLFSDWDASIKKLSEAIKESIIFKKK